MCGYACAPDGALTPLSPPLPLTGPFQHFVKACHDDLAAKLTPTGSSAADINRALMAQWRKLSAEEQQVYRNMHTQHCADKLEKQRVSACIPAFQKLVVVALTHIVLLCRVMTFLHSES